MDAVDPRVKCYKDCLKAKEGNQRFCRDKCKDIGDGGGNGGGNGGGKPGFQDDIDRDAAIVAAEAMRTCLAVPKTFAECIEDPTVRQKLAEAVGKEADDITEENVKMYIKLASKMLSALLMAECREGCEDAGNCRECLKSVKDQLKELLGRDTSEIDTAKLIREGAQDEVREILQGCQTTKDECLEAARQAKSEALGMSKDKIKDSHLKKDFKESVARQMMQAIKTCREDEELTTPELKKECIQEAKRVVRWPFDGGNSDAEPDREQVRRRLREALKTAAKEIMQECESQGGDRATCTAQVKEHLKLMRGEQVTDIEVGEVEQEGARESALETLEACKQAKELDDTMTDDCAAEAVRLYKKAKGDRGRGRSRDTEMKKDVAKHLLVKQSSACFEEATEEEIRSCMDEFKEQSRELIRELAGSGSTNLPSWRLLEKSATRKVLGRRFWNCVRAAREEDSEPAPESEPAAEEAVKTECKEQLRGLQSKTTFEERVEDVLARFAGTQVATFLEECPEDLRTCVQEAKEMIQNTDSRGKRWFKRFVRLGVWKRTAEAYAACIEDAAAEDTCKAEAMDLYKRIRLGTNESAIDADKEEAVEARFEKIFDKIKRIATWLQDGEDSVLKADPVVDVELNSAEDETCDDGKVAEIRAAVVEAANACASSLKPDSGDWTADEFSTVPCSLDLFRARYSFKLQLIQQRSFLASQAEDFAKCIFDRVEAAKNGVRRLSGNDYEEVYASQQTDEALPANEATTTNPQFVGAAPRAGLTLLPITLAPLFALAA